MTGSESQGRRIRYRRWLASALFAFAVLIQAHPLCAAESTAAKTMTSAPFDRAISRYVTRTENTGERLALSLSTVVTTWLWIGLSVFAFLAVVLLAAAADWEMFSLVRNGMRGVPLYMFRGGGTFLRVFRDRHTPNYARLVLLGGLAYWLLPGDFVPDESIIPGFLEDILVAIVSAKTFVVLCPDGVIAKHARALQGPAKP